MSGRTSGGRRLLIRTIWSSALTWSMSRAAAAIPSAGGSPSRVTVSSKSVLSMLKVMTAVRPADDRAAADLAQRGGHPDLVLGVKLQAGGQIPAQLAGGVDVGPVPDVEAGEFTDHDLSTRTPASSR